MDHRFNTTGNVAINIRLLTDTGKAYITTCTLTIHAVERRVAESEITFVLEERKSSRTSESVLGATYAVHLGCDSQLNKPIIIAEGFDPDDKVSTNVLAEKYIPNMGIYARNGYDFVFVSYSNNTASISENAQVLKRVINDIKGRISATDSIILVG